MAPLEVTLAERGVVLGGRRERALLGILLLAGGEVVPVERLIDGIWGDAPPSSAKHMVHECVSRLRHALGDASRIATRPPGYAAVCAADELDAARFSQLVAKARATAGAGNEAGALDAYDDALALWRGGVLADVPLEGDVRLDAERLEQERVLVGEERVECALALGHHRELIPELERRLAEEPMRERGRYQLMLALYRSGRQTDALECYREGRALFVERAGIEPGAELRALERAILRQDPELDRAPPAAPPVVATTPGARKRRPVWQRRRGIALGLVTATALTALTVVIVGSRGGATAVPPLSGNAVAMLDPVHARLIGSIPVGTDPGPITAATGDVWVSNLGDSSVSRISPAAEQTIGTVQLGMRVTGLAGFGGSVFAVGMRPIDPFVTVERVDPTFDAPRRLARVSTVVAGDPASIVATRTGRLLVAPASGVLTRMDRSGAHANGIADPDATSIAAAQGFGSTWLAEPTTNAVVRIEPGGTLTTIPVGRGPSAVAIGAGRVWVANQLDDTVKSIDPATNSVDSTFSVGGAPTGIAVAGTSVWVADSGTAAVTRIDAVSKRVTANVTVGGSPQAVVVAYGKVWVSIQRRSVPQTPASDGTAVVTRSSPLTSLDPALAYEPADWQIEYATCAELVNYPDTAGAAGSRLVPDATSGPPKVSSDGRTYTFSVRPGQRFSPPSGELVTAATFAHSLERSLSPRLGSNARVFFANIAGAPAYMAGRAAHIAGIRARGQVLTIRLVRPQPDFLARLAIPFSCAVPLDTPLAPVTGALPSAGPYYVAIHSQSQGVVLERNPNYHGRRPNTLRRIVIRFGVSDERGVAQVEAGDADYLMSNVPASQAERLRRLYGEGSAAAAAGDQRYFVNPILGLDYVALNTSRPLFASARMRQAASFAIDRAALAAAGNPYGAPATLTGSYLPLGMPGYRPVPVSTPNVARARALAGNGRHHALLFTCNAPPCPQVARIVTADLAAIGIDVETRFLDPGVLFTKTTHAGEPYDLAFVGWFADYDDPADFLRLQLAGALDGGINFAHYHDPALVRALAAADRLSPSRRLIAYAELNAKLVRDSAPWIAYANPVSQDFVSARTGCVTYQPVYGIDLAALCIRARGARR